MFAVDRIAAGTGEGNAPHECLPHKNNLGEISGTAVRVDYLSRQQRRRPVVLNCREYVVENKDLVVFWVVRRHHHPRRSGQYRLAAANARERTGLSAERNTAAFFVARLIQACEEAPQLLDDQDMLPVHLVCSNVTSGFHQSIRIKDRKGRTLHDVFATSRSAFYRMGRPGRQ
jgi:hypothetical protein